MKKLWILFIAVILVLIGFIWFSPSFERVSPKIDIITNGYTNLKNPIKIKISDNRGVKSYQVIVKGNGFDEVIAKSVEPVLGKNVELSIKLPHIDTKNIQIIVLAKDTSYWHFFRGNQSIKKTILQVDTTGPDVDIINNSYAIGRGGSAVAVVKISDNNLKNAYILVNNKYKFKLTPFVKKDYYISLLAWPFNENNFDAEVIADDLAGNSVQVHIPFYWRTKGIYQFKNKKLTITDSFIQNVAKNVLEKMGMSVPGDPVKIFKAENETLRKADENEIFKITDKIYENKINNFYLKRFYPLPGSKKEAGFMELRHYFYKGKEISTAIHKGIDLARIKNSKVYASNKGVVKNEKYMGIYGNTLFVYHRLGLYSTYSHLSEFLVKKGDNVHVGEVIAKTGSTGGVFGDHLHFGIYVQGIPVQPLEWMDPRWIKTNILKIIYDAKRTILQ